MKKVFLLALLPAVLALSSCQAVQKTKTNVSLDSIVEDTEAHEEIFRKVDFEKTDLGVRKLSTIEESAPAIGIQSKIDTVEAVDYISIRFVAAVDFGSSLEPATAKWYRTMFGTDGHVLGGRIETEKACSKAYTSLYDESEDDDELTIAEYNSRHSTTYTHFVVYTMTGIPKVANASCYLTAYLSVDLDGEGPGEAVTSKVVATTVDQKTQFSFNKNDTGCFGVKLTGGGCETFNKAGSTKEGFWATFANVNMDGGDAFLLANRGIDLGNRNNDFFAVYGYERLRAYDGAYEGHSNGFYNFTQLGTSQFSVCPEDMQKYYFYVENDTNRIMPKYSVTKTVTLNPGVWAADNPNYELYVSDYDGFGTNHWYDLSGSGSAYSISLSNIPDCAVLIFCRMNPSGTAHSWDGKWDQTVDLSILGGSNYSISGWGTGNIATGSWA